MGKVKWIYLVYIFLSIGGGMIIYAWLTFQVDDIKINNEEVIAYNTGWYYMDNEGKKAKVELPINVNWPANKEFTIINTLPDQYFSGMTFCIRTSQQELKLFIDSNLIWEYGINNERKFGKSPGSAWHLVRIPPGSEGKNVMLVTKSPYDNFSGKVNKITYGTKNANVFYILGENAVGFILCFTSFVLGFIFLIIYLWMRCQSVVMKSLHYLSLFTIMVSLWSITETRMLQFVVGNQTILNFITFIALMLWPIPFLLLIKEMYDSKKEKIYDLLCFLFSINFIVAILLQLTGYVDLFEFVQVTHFLMALSAIVIIYFTVQKVIEKHNKESFWLATSIIVLSFFSGIDLIRFYHNHFNDSAYYSRIGLLLYIAILGIISIQRAAVIFKQSMEARYFQQLAYRDALTGIKNRVSFEVELSNMEENKDTGRLSLVMFDVDDFKTINDTYGHLIGDKVLKIVANEIADSFQSFGEVYRIGGDEFIVIIKEKQDAEIIDCLNDLKNRVEIYNDKFSPKISLSSGTASFSPEEDERVRDLFNRADRQMYNHKKHKRT